MKKINLSELKQIIKNIIKETIYHTNVVSLKDPIQPLVKSLKKNKIIL
jgi:hypothetical protein